MKRPAPRAAAALRLSAVLALAALAGCTVIPQQQAPVVAPPPVAPPSNVLPADVERHRVALLVPLAGPDAAVGQAIANATTMALLDMNARSLRITTYDTAAGADVAAQHAIADGNRLILGPLLREDAGPVAQVARGAGVPVISYSNDTTVAGGDVFVMGDVPGAGIAREIAYARAHGIQRFAALIPVGTYGERASTAMLAAVRSAGGQMVGMENYQHTAASMAAAVKRLRAHGAADAVLIADSGRGAAAIAPLLARPGAAPPLILGTTLWSGEPVVAHTPALEGAEFAAMPDARFRHFADSYKARFGAAPFPIATLGYDSVLLALRIARDWPAGAPFPTGRLHDRDGFLGIDGAMRFGDDGVIERALELRAVSNGAVTVVSPAPTRFGD